MYIYFLSYLKTKIPLFIFRKYPLKRQKRETISFLVLITVRIKDHFSCQSSTCQARTLSRIATRCSERATIILEFLFVSFTNGLIQYDLIFISFTITSMLNDFSFCLSMKIRVFFFQFLFFI